MKLLLVLIFLSSIAFGNESALSRKVDAFLVVSDYTSALEIAKQNLNENPDSATAHEMLFRTYAAIGDERGLLSSWEAMSFKFKERANEREILEEMALGILKRGCEADSLITRLIGFLAIAKTELPDAVSLIEKGLKDSNANLRSLNVELASYYGDEPLREIIVELFHKETNVDVRISLLKAIDKLKIKELIPSLVKKLEKNSNVTSSEKKAMVSTLASLREDISREELMKLIGSGRNWEALLACEMIVKWDLDKECDLLEPLVDKRINKGTKEIIVEATKTLGLFQKGEAQIFEERRFDHDPQIGIMASWALGFADPSSIDSSFTYWLKHENGEIRNLAASALMMHGKRGVGIAQACLQETTDPFLKANLAWHLLQQRKDIEKNGEILFNFLKETKDKLMWEKGFFSYFHKSTLSHAPLMPNLPEAMNQMVRLEILNLLSIVEYKKAEEAIREFLKETRWEVAGLAAETLLQEGDESAISLVKKLLDDPDKHVQSQAALLLAMWGKDKAAINKLKELYFVSDRSLKIKILEALGGIGDEETIPFLIDRLKEPSRTIRLVGACILLQTLYH